MKNFEQMVQPLCNRPFAQLHYFRRALLTLLECGSQYEDAVDLRFQVNCFQLTRDHCGGVECVGLRKHRFGTYQVSSLYQMYETPPPMAGSFPGA